ncbi:MAG: hypothetical protein GYA16_08975 [Spirochaetes bacterium]|nr:hypothetical protein [Spirochaetota bacterium]
MKNSGLDEYTVENPSNYLFVLKQKTGESLIISTDRFEIVFDGYLPGIKGVDLEIKVLELAEKIVLRKNIDYNDYGGIFNICIRDKADKNIYLKSDPSALLPLYYGKINQVFYYCSHGHIMGQCLDSQPDFSGIMQKVTLGYTLGNQYYYKNISRINPGETIIYNADNHNIESTYSQLYYIGYTLEKDIEEELFTSLNISFSKQRKNYSEIGLMLSEGFDSRFLGGFSKKNSFNIIAFTHGTFGTKGHIIVEKVARTLDCEHHFQSMINGYNYNIRELSNQIYQADNINYPFWILGSEFYKKVNATYPVIIGSSLDCILGGNIFYKTSKKVLSAVLQRYVEIFKQDTGILSERYIESLSSQILNSLLVKNIKVYSGIISETFNIDLANLIIDELKNLNDYIKNEIDRISKTGSLLPSLQLQRYILENRDRKLFFGQPLTIRRHSKIYIPSFEYGFLSRASAINPIHKLHHKLYLNIYKKFFPQLLKIENGSYGIRPVYPRYILETNRFLLKSKERRLYRYLLEKRGKMDLSGFRSASIFELCGRDDKTYTSFEDLITVNSDIFRVDTMKHYISDARNYKIRVFNYERFFRGLELCMVQKKKI